MQQYEIVLKNEKEKTYFIISWILLIANFISILILTISIHFTKLGPLILSFLAFACIFIPMYFKEKNEKLTYYWAFFFFSLAWFSSHNDWLGSLNLLFGLLDVTARRKLFVRVDKNCVEYPSFIFKRALWKDISNVILKDGMLTIDFKNNKIFQQLIDEKMQSVNEKEFNDFCRQQLNQ
jgi:hypothetical protein